MTGPQMTQIYADLKESKCRKGICVNLRNLRMNPSFSPNEK